MVWILLKAQSHQTDNILGYNKVNKYFPWDLLWFLLFLLRSPWFNLKHFEKLLRNQPPLLTSAVLPQAASVAKKKVAESR